jgi:dienelactone hydrolase
MHALCLWEQTCVLDIQTLLGVNWIGEKNMGANFVAVAGAAGLAGAALWLWRRRSAAAKDVSGDPCCAAGTLVFSNATPEQGKVEKLGGGVESYVTGEVGIAKAALVIASDIFGFANSNTRANADMLAAAGYLVVVPDFFHGHSAGSLPELTPESIKGFVARHGTWERTRRDLIEQVVPLCKAAGAERLFFLGFCWGGKMALEVAADPELASAAAVSFAAVGGVHASLKDPVDAEAKAAAARVPVMLLQASNDADVRPVYAALASNERPSVATRSVARTFHDQVHGWCGARGDRTNPRLAAAVRSALQSSVDFFADARKQQ